MEPFKLDRMTPKEIQELMASQYLSRIAFKGDDHPYIAPFQYAFVKGELYFHFSNYGRKIRYLDEDPNVCVEIEQNTTDMSEYKFITLRGTLAIVKDKSEKATAIFGMWNKGRRELSRSFLAAHGLGTDMDWKDFTADNAHVVVKLVNITEITGLRSPRTTV